ncbi:U1 snRNP component [Maudiozyma exigua]|uniref:U1 small nuclear ribonucleoprotein component SNU71 n=1 Tax=Maudiozyma exigua TaxID=34358 RepID=A0A9P6VTY4_MAUEX|nr:U1 snRNP component [Kazachstania exigua]
MENVIFVCPQKFLISQSKWTSDTERKGFIPILRADLPKLEDSLNKTIDKNRIVLTDANGKPNSKGIKNNQSTDKITNKENSGIITNKSDAYDRKSRKLSKYQPIKQFLPISLKQQLHTISIKGVKSNLTESGIDNFLNALIELFLTDLEVDEQKKYPLDTIVECWTSVSSAGIPEQTLFVRFKQDILIYPHVVLFLKELLGKTLQICYDSNVSLFIKDILSASSIPKISITEQDEDKFSQLIERINSDDKSIEKDNYDESSTEYHIDLNTLNDIPMDDLDQLCKDIIEFRTKVVTMEKEKNQQEIYNERERQRTQMMKMFDRIKVNSSSKDEKSNGDISMDVEQENDQDMNDSEDKEDIEKQESNRRYLELLSTLNSNIEPRILKIHSNLESATNYENVLIENISINKKELIRLGNDEFYDHHRSFKELEEIKDKEDKDTVGDDVDMPVVKTTTGISEGESVRETENEEKVGNVINIKFAFKKAIDNSANEKTEELEGGQRSSETVETLEEKISENERDDILPFIDQDLTGRLSRLRKSKFIDELVKEYLGVYEDELVDYIFENITEHKSKQVLLDDLKETFDDDAIVMVDRIWERKEFE